MANESTEIYRAYFANNTTAYDMTGQTRNGQMFCVDKMPGPGGGQQEREARDKTWRMTLEGGWLFVRCSDIIVCRVPSANIVSVETMADRKAWLEARAPKSPDPQPIRPNGPAAA